MEGLHRSQLAAIRHVSLYARERGKEARQAIAHVLKMSDLSPDAFEDAVSKVRTHARVALHFHPDRPDSRLVTVAEALLEAGIYKSQFETGLSSGSVSAHQGGERDLWEERLFGGAYHRDGVTHGHRPKYGAWNLTLAPDGPAPRFGSCYFLLYPEVSRRCTFTYLDSHSDPEEKGTLEELDDILAGLLTEAFLRDFAIGERNLTPSRLVEHLRQSLDKPFPNPSRREPSRNLNHYIEAQVHGDVRLEPDVETLVADPSFQQTPTGDLLYRLCQRYGIALFWHGGFELPVEKVPSDFRGPTMPSLARRVAQEERALDVSQIGRAAMELKRDPDQWRDRGTYAEVLQELKYLWHVLVRLGGPHTRSR